MILRRADLYNQGKYIPVDDFIKNNKIQDTAEINKLQELDKLRQDWVNNLNKNITHKINLFTSDYNFENIIYRWGQLNMDYNPVHQYIASLVENSITSYSQIINNHYGEIQGIEQWFSDLPVVIESMENTNEIRNEALEYLKAVLLHQNQAKL